MSDCFRLYPLEHAYDLDRIAVIPVGNLNAGCIGGGMDNLSISNIHSYMIDSGTTGIE